MRCDEADALIDAFAEDALDVGERETVAAHLETCAACRRALAAARRLTSSLVSLPSAEPSYAADARVLAAVEEERAWAAARSRSRRMAAAFAAFAVLATAGTVALAYSPSSTWIAERATVVVHSLELWVRFRAATVAVAALGPLAAILGLLVLVAVMERATAPRRFASRA